MGHPGPLIRERFLEPLGINANRLAIGIGVDRSTVGRLLGGNQPVSPAMAARLGAYFQVPARWFLLMQAEHDAERLEQDPTAATGVIPFDVGPDWLLTPDGAISLLPSEEEEPTALGVRTVQLDNGAIVLTSEAS